MGLLYCLHEGRKILEPLLISFQEKYEHYYSSGLLCIYGAIYAYIYGFFLC
jgi:hypothetical protein